MINESEKKYSKSLDDKTKDAKNKVVNHLIKRWNVEIKEKDKTIILCCKDKKSEEVLFNVVMEVRFSWNTFNFPYETVTIPYRKKELLENDIPIFYFVLNEFGNAVIVTTKENIINSEIIYKDTMYTAHEKFYEVPLIEFNKGFNDLIEYIEANLKKEPIEDYEEVLEEFKKPIIMYLCPNCEIVSQVPYKPGLKCPICNSILFNH